MQPPSSYTTAHTVPYAAVQADAIKPIDRIQYRDQSKSVPQSLRQRLIPNWRAQLRTTFRLKITLIAFNWRLLIRLTELY